MTGWADGGYCALGAMKLQLQITYARERRGGGVGAVGGSVDRDNPNNVFNRRARAKPNGTSVEHNQRCWTRYNTNMFVLVDSFFFTIAPIDRCQ